MLCLVDEWSDHDAPGSKLSFLTLFLADVGLVVGGAVFSPMDIWRIAALPPSHIIYCHPIPYLSICHQQPTTISLIHNLGMRMSLFPQLDRLGARMVQASAG